MPKRLLNRHRASLSVLTLAIAFGIACFGPLLNSARAAASPVEPVNSPVKGDHQNMMEQLGITRLRPGPNGQPGFTNSANYDPAKANPFPNLPELLVLKNGNTVTTPEVWWKQRRPEIVEDFEREVIGRIPPQVPKVSWTVVSNSNTARPNLPLEAKTPRISPSMLTC